MSLGATIKDVVINLALGGMGKAQAEVEKLTKAVDDLQKKAAAGAASGTQTPAQASALAAEIEKAKAALSQAEAASVGLTHSLVALGVVAVATAAAFKVISISLQEAKELNRQYWENNAIDAEHSFHRQAAAAVRHAQERRALYEANVDLTHQMMIPERMAREADREKRIQIEQGAMAGRPLADRMEVRNRIESQGSNEEKSLELRERLKHFDLKSNELEKDKSRIELEQVHVRDAQQAHSNRLKDEKFNAQPTRLGSALEHAFKHDIYKLSLGIFKPNRVGAADWMASAVGATTPGQAEEFNKKQTVNSKTSELELAKQEKQQAIQLKAIGESQQENDKKRLETRVQLLTVSREEQKQARMAAEAGREHLTNTKLNYGRADEGEKAYLRSIQAKADRGETLNRHEASTAESYGINASKQARQQALASAERDAHLFSDEEGLQKALDKRDAKANAPGVKVEQSDLSTSIKEDVGKIKAGITDFKELLNGVSEMAKAVENLQTELFNANQDVKRTLAKNRNWVGS